MTEAQKLWHEKNKPRKRLYMKAYRERNKEEIDRKQRERYKKNPRLYLETSRKWAERNKDRSRAIKRKHAATAAAKQRAHDRYMLMSRASGKVFRAKRPPATSEQERLDRQRECRRLSAKRNRPKIAIHQKRQYHTSPKWKLRATVRSRMTTAFRRMAAGKKSATTIDLLGCSIDELRLHIQSQFKPGMAWNNYGFRGWHVDHIRPLATFDLFDPEQQREAFSWRNLQPMWGLENIRKGCRYDGAKQAA